MAGPVLNPGHPVVYCSRTLHPQFSASISPGFILGLCYPWSLSLHHLCFQLLGAMDALSICLSQFCLSVPASNLSLLSPPNFGRPPRDTTSYFPAISRPGLLAPKQLVSSWSLGGAPRSRRGKNRTRETPGAGGAWLERSTGKAALGSPGGSGLARASKASETASSPRRREGREWGGEMGLGEGTVGKTGRRPGLEEGGGPVSPSLGAGL